MATAFNLLKSSLTHSPFLNNQHIHEHFKSNSFSSFKFPLKLHFTQINCNHSKPNTTFLLKLFVKPLITLSPQPNLTTHAFEVLKPLFYSGAWLSTSRRGDFRAWSRRRPGSKSGGKKNRLSIALECTGCSGNRYTTEKRRVPRVDTRKASSEKKKDDKKAKSGEGLMLSKYCPKCRKHFPHKEVKIGPSK